MIRKTFSIKSFTLIFVFTACLFVVVTTKASITACANTSGYPNANSPLGINVTGIDDWTTQWPFVDAFKLSRPWISQHKGSAWGQGGALHLTPSGGIASL